MKQSINNRETGSALLTAMLFSFVVVTLLGSYLYLASSDYRSAKRSFLFGASFNLAESGVDLAIHALNEADFSGWRTGTDTDGRSYRARSFGSYDLGHNIDGDIHVVVLDPGSASPEVFSEGVASGRVMGAVAKQVRAELTSDFYPFLNGFDSKEGILFEGNDVVFDSYESSGGAYTFATKKSEITLAAATVESDSGNAVNADIYGYVVTGDLDPDVGASGSITSYANPGEIDMSRVTNDFYSDLPSISAPTLSHPSNSIPASGTILGGDYQLNALWMWGNRVVTIYGDTRIVVTGSLLLFGNASIVVESGATLELYLQGSASVGGRGIENDSMIPSQLKIFGTDSQAGRQSISLGGEVVLSAAIYAPNAEVTLDGSDNGGRFLGAVTAYETELDSVDHFSYDESLAGVAFSGTKYKIAEWVELSGVGLHVMRLDMDAYGF